MVSRIELDLNEPVITPREMADLLRAVRITRADGTFYWEREKKYHEIQAFLTHLLVLEREMKRDRELLLVDGGCGKSYLSFVLNHVLSRKVGRPARFLGVDANPEILRTCDGIARDLGFTNMEFRAGRVLDLDPGASPDIVFALHACDTATDETIAMGIRHQARAVAVAPCCHRELKRTLGTRHPLSRTGHFPVLREHLAIMLTDAVRALTLEAAGYGVTVIEFVQAKHTPKNILIRARRRSYQLQARPMEAYRELKGTFGFRSSLESYLPDLFSPPGEPDPGAAEAASR
jgi:hypothetical protein